MNSPLRVAVLLAAVALLAVPATAKEAVRAYLDAPVDIDTPAGRTITVKWHLKDAEGRPFGGRGIYLRVSRCNRRAMRVRAIERPGGAYMVRLKVPRPRIRKLMVGLPGIRIYRGRTTRADAYFQFDPPLYSRRDCRR
jgi:hypothetical protein